MGTYTFVLEYDADVQDVYLIRGSLRAYRDTDNPLTVYVRTEEGPIDLSAVETLEAVIVGGFGPWPYWGWDYGLVPTYRPLVTVTAYSPVAGRVMFTLSAENLSQLFSSSYTLFVRGDNRTLYTANLEVV